MLQFIAGVAVGAVIMVITFWRIKNQEVASLCETIKRSYDTIDNIHSFIDKNIQERVVYSSAETPYSSDDKSENKEPDQEDAPEPESEEVTAEELNQIAEEIAKQNEEGRK
jgi:hypothetical protein